MGRMSARHPRDQPGPDTGPPQRWKGRRPFLEYFGQGLVWVGMACAIGWSTFGARGGVLGLINGALASGLPVWPIVGVPLIFVGLMLAGVLLHRQVRRRMRVLLRAHDCKLCLRCRYLLSDLPDHGRCPECGEPYALERLRGAWERTYRDLG